MDELSKLMAKKKDAPEMSPEEIQAKLEVVKELMAMAQEAMGDGVKRGLDDMHASKVSVMAPDKEGLEEGLEKASDLVAGAPDEMMVGEADEESQVPESEDESREDMEAGDLESGEAEMSDDEDEDKPKKRGLFDL